MGRHSAPDADDEVGGAPAAVVDAPTDAAADRRGRHTRVEDEQHTGPVPGTPMRPADERAAAQDERPTEQLTLADIAAAAGVEPELEPEPAAAPLAETRAPAPAGPAEPAVPVLTEATPAEPAASTSPPKPPRGAQSTGADLALIRQHPELRNRVLGAALAPFVVYAAVLLLLSAKGVQYLLWIWIPMVTAGVLIGLVLDAGHKRYPKAGAE